MGNTGRTSCRCGWQSDEIEAASGPECTNKLRVVYNNHLLAVAPGLCPNCTGTGTQSSGFVASVGTVATADCWVCEGTGERIPAKVTDWIEGL